MENNMVNNKRNCGRPAGRKKTAKIEVTIEPSVKNEFMNMLHREGKTASAEICQWIRIYIKKHGQEEPFK